MPASPILILQRTWAPPSNPPFVPGFPTSHSRNNSHYLRNPYQYPGSPGHLTPPEHPSSNDGYEWLDDAREDDHFNELLDTRYRSAFYTTNDAAHPAASGQNKMQNMQGQFQDLFIGNMNQRQSMPGRNDNRNFGPRKYGHHNHHHGRREYTHNVGFQNEHQHRNSPVYQDLISALEASLTAKSWGAFFHNTKILLGMPEGRSLDLFTLRVYSINMMIFTMVRDPRPLTKFVYKAYEKIVKKLTQSQRRHIVIEKILGICSIAWKKTDKDYRLDSLIARYQQIHCDPHFERYILGFDEAIEILNNLVTLTRLRAVAFILKRYNDNGSTVCPLSYVSYNLSFQSETPATAQRDCYNFLLTVLKPDVSIVDITPTCIHVTERLRDHIKSEINARKRIYWEVVLNFRKTQNLVKNGVVRLVDGNIVAVGVGVNGNPMTASLSSSSLATANLPNVNNNAANPTTVNAATSATAISMPTSSASYTVGHQSSAGTGTTTSTSSASPVDHENFLDSFAPNQHLNTSYPYAPAFSNAATLPSTSIPHSHTLDPLSNLSSLAQSLPLPQPHYFPRSNSLPTTNSSNPYIPYNYPVPSLSISLSSSSSSPSHSDDASDVSDTTTNTSSAGVRSSVVGGLVSSNSVSESSTKDHPVQVSSDSQSQSEHSSAFEVEGTEREQRHEEVELENGNMGVSKTPVEPKPTLKQTENEESKEKLQQPIIPVDQDTVKEEKLGGSSL
ncbi:hypothetical protein BKA69DRAFT_1041076 [Paraphysoderma sedebokerense]|nr:hypothetical protein BKA69DRAFT_1041076 [Paraphysoderma sedebokerense]